MKYVGGKQLIGKDISELIVKIISPNKVKGYIEPFIGGLGVFQHMCQKQFKIIIGSDLQEDLIMLWKEIQGNTFNPPRKVSQLLFNKLKSSKEHSALRAFIGFGMSFGGDFFAGYIQKYSGTSGRNFYNELLNFYKRISPILKNEKIKFYNKSYEYFNKKTGYVIYCDPPYCNTTGYKTGDFDNEKFWNTMRYMSKNNYVFISEEKAPNDFVSIWSKSKFRSLTPSKTFHSSEYLFVKKNSLAHISYKKNLKK
tara:strand:- start:75 stop:833 length:759 start_codon:yes stop_codon:yes gene_type:complete